MGLFTKEIPLAEVFNGFVDSHCHILPGVDDGFQKMADSVEILRLYREAGVRKVILTPHIMEDFPNTPDTLNARFEELKQAIKDAGVDTPELKLSAEHMLDSLFVDRLVDEALVPHETGHVLVETSYFNPPYNMESMLESVKDSGFYPILAHPERYIYMAEKDYKKLKAMGVKFQMNLSSLAGLYGPEARKKALWMLDKNYYDFVGTDLHRLHIFKEYTRVKISAKVLDKVRKLSDYQ